MEFKKLEYIDRDSLLAYLSDKLFWEQQRLDYLRKLPECDISAEIECKTRLEIIEEVLEEIGA